MSAPLFRLDAPLFQDPAIAAWWPQQPPHLAALALPWWSAMRNVGDEVLELFHDGCPVALFGNVPFAYVNIFTAHVNVGFFRGASLPDPARLLQGTGKSMRHLRLRPHQPLDPARSPT